MSKPDPNRPEHERSPAWTVDPYVGKPYGYDRPLLLSPGSWWRKNFTLGNMLTILFLIGAMLSWVRVSETAVASAWAEVASVQKRVDRLEHEGASRDLVDAKLDGLAAQLAAINRRLERIESQRSGR